MLSYISYTTVLWLAYRFHSQVLPVTTWPSDRFVGYYIAPDSSSSRISNDGPKYLIWNSRGTPDRHFCDVGHVRNICWRLLEFRTVCHGDTMQYWGTFL